MANGGYSISNIYQGGYSSLNPKYGDVFTGYRINPASIGITTDPRTANVIQDASSKLSTGAKQIELSLVSPEIFDSIPKQQLKEINRLSKLTGVDVSVHAPVVDSSGITQQGFSEVNREIAERKISDALIRSHEVNPDGNSPVTFHSAEGLPGTEWETLGEKREARRLIAINRETGKMIPLEEEKKFYPITHNEEGEIIGPVSEKGKIMTPKESLEAANATDWDNKLSQLFFNKERADEILEQNRAQIQHLMDYINEAKKKREKISLTPMQEQAYLRYQDAQNYLNDIRKHTNEIFSKAYEFGTSEQREQLKKISEEFVENTKKQPGIIGYSRAMGVMLNELKENPKLVPKMYIPIEQFAIEKSSKTFGNAAFNAYKKFGDKAPILSIENPPVGFALSTGEDLKKLIEESRKRFVERAVKEKKINPQEAEKLAAKFIGATWDVGHINMLRKHGFEKEAIIRETEKIAPFVKHVHLSDNFGFEHTELPIGMGNVPIKEIMNKLGKEGFDAKKIIEAGQWWQHFKKAPFKETLEAFGSPLYAMDMAPYWNQNMGFQQDYYGGLAGNWLPQTNYETFGAGFARLPMELGGQQRAQGSRMSGRPME